MLTKADFMVLADMGIPIFQYIVREDKNRYVPGRIKQIILRRYDSRCRVCGTSSNLQIDHVIPIDRGGTNDIRNLQILCGRCNLQKGVNIISEQSYKEGYIIIDEQF